MSACPMQQLRWHALQSSCGWERLDGCASPQLEQLCFACAFWHCQRLTGPVYSSDNACTQGQAGQPGTEDAPIQEANGQEGEDDEEALDDMQLAWEMLEMARKLYSAAQPPNVSALAGMPFRGHH